MKATGANPEENASQTSADLEKRGRYTPGVSRVKSASEQWENSDHHSDQGREQRCFPSDAEASPQAWSCPKNRTSPLQQLRHLSPVSPSQVMLRSIPPYKNLGPLPNRTDSRRGVRWRRVLVSDEMPVRKKQSWRPGIVQLETNLQPRSGSQNDQA